MTEPLRRLEDKNVEFQWLDQHSIAMNTIKEFLTETPVIRYYDVSKPGTVKCDEQCCCKMVSQSVLLPVPSLTQSLDMHRSRKSYLPSLGLLASLTRTSMGETKALSRLTTSHSSLYSKRQFTSHPSACSECAWPCKSTTRKFNTRKVPLCTLQMP